VSYCGTHRANSQPFEDWEAEENGTNNWNGRLRKDYKKFGQDVAISLEEEAIFVQPCKSRACDLDLEHILDARSPGDHHV